MGSESGGLGKFIRNNKKDITYVLSFLTAGGFITHEKLTPEADDATIQEVVREEHVHDSQIKELQINDAFQDKLIKELVEFRTKYWEHWDSPDAVEQRRKEANAVEIAEENKKEIQRLHPRR